MHGAPASTDLVITLISAMAGSLASSTINNYISAIRTWHIIHHTAWNIDHTTIDTALRAATVYAPPKSAKPLRQPVAINYLTTILNHLNKNHPLDAAIAACITTTFCIKQHITTKATALDQDRNGLQVQTFKLPFTKLARGKAFQNHLRINAPPPGAHIFTYKTNRRKALTPLTKRKVIKRVRAITPTTSPTLKATASASEAASSTFFKAYLSTSYNPWADEKATPSNSTYTSTRKSWHHTSKPTLPQTLDSRT
jgi:hypothetical protein